MEGLKMNQVNSKLVVVVVNEQGELQTQILQVADTCTMILKKFLADPMIPKPKSCLFTSWYSLVSLLPI